jgi:hypothetical protein
MAGNIGSVTLKSDPDTVAQLESNWYTTVYTKICQDASVSECFDELIATLRTEPWWKRHSSEKLRTLLLNLFKAAVSAEKALARLTHDKHLNRRELLTLLIARVITNRSVLPQSAAAVLNEAFKLHDEVIFFYYIIFFYYVVYILLHY